jgi:hypothetical protein
MPSRAILTIAAGKAGFLDMAVALARSFRRWNDPREITFLLVTDLEADLPADLDFIVRRQVPGGTLGRGFSSKLQLDQFAPEGQTLFIDADCLCVGSLNEALEVFRGHAVSVIGREISGGDWFGDVAAICRQHGVPALPRFNGGVYYLEQGEACRKIYETARKFETRYDDIGFARLRGRPNDEVLMALAMALHGEKPVPEKGDIMNSLLAAPGGLDIDVFGGRAVLRNPRYHARHNDWYAMEEMQPKIVHFAGMDPAAFPYKSERMRLELVYGRGWSRPAATLWTNLTFSLPWKMRAACKTVVRPIFHATMGPRKRAVSMRVAEPN